ncbi:glycosyltransferase family 2 protein [Pseudofulvibacter geojedonensis]|uniref:Glycosyltransferase family 2 protein n=1 Tax=Pseudofulvibacter geojedonensis TaxID=1123758 RepID=A0ABW3HZT4_9FLAO
MQLSVIILNYNVCSFLELCIKSVKSAIENIEAEIIVIDNNSPDDSCSMVKKLFPEITLIENKENVGFAKANNQGVAIAKGEYVCILNPDTVVANNTFTEILTFAKTKQNLGIIGCRLIDGTGAFLPESKREVPTPIVSLKKMLGLSESYYASNVQESDVAKVPILVGAFMLMKKEVYEEVNGFDETYFMYGEDIDLSYTILKAGYTNYYYGKTSVIHYKGESTLKDATYANRFYGAMQIFYKKHFRKNLFFDLVVKMGVKLIPLLKKEKDFDKVTLTETVLVSNNNDLLHQLEKAKSGLVLLKTKEQIDTSEKGVIEYVLDANYVSYQEIIQLIIRLKTTNSYFKIVPNNSHFALGSNSSKSRGEVILLD